MRTLHLTLFLPSIFTYKVHVSIKFCTGKYSFDPPNKLFMVVVSDSRQNHEKSYKKAPY